MNSEPIVLRPAESRDATAIRLVAGRDSAPTPKGDALVGEVGGDIVAAIAVRDGAVVADPFRPAASIVELLRERRGQLVA